MLYPEQNEARLKLSLDGTWAFALGSCVEDQFDPAKPLPDAQPIAVPASYNDQNDQTTALRRHYGWAWYQRKVTLPTFCAGQRVVLRFGSVTHTANVWLNGQLIAQHKGGFTPFEADVTALLHPGETVLLTVACDNRVNHSTLPVGNEDGQLAFFGSDNAGIPSVKNRKFILANDPRICRKRSETVGSSCRRGRTFSGRNGKENGCFGNDGHPIPQRVWRGRWQQPTLFDGCRRIVTGMCYYRGYCFCTHFFVRFSDL